MEAFWILRKYDKVDLNFILMNKNYFFLLKVSALFLFKNVIFVIATTIHIHIINVFVVGTVYFNSKPH